MIIVIDITENQFSVIFGECLKLVSFFFQQKIFDQGCNKDTHPEDDLEKRNNCNRDWLGAKDAIDKVDVDGFDGLARKLRKSHRIRVYASKPNVGRMPPSNECDNVNWILKYGWCKIADDTQSIWGICSPSCEFLGV